MTRLLLILGMGLLSVGMPAFAQGASWVSGCRAEGGNVICENYGGVSFPPQCNPSAVLRCENISACDLKGQVEDQDGSLACGESDTCFSAHARMKIGDWGDPMCSVEIENGCSHRIVCDIRIRGRHTDGSFHDSRGTAHIFPGKENGWGLSGVLNCARWNVDCQNDE